MPALLAVALALPLTFSVLILLEEVRLDGPAGKYAVVGLTWCTVSLVAAPAAWALDSARQQLHRCAQVIDAAAVTAHDWMWESDAEDRITYSNDAVIELLGFRPSELVGVSAFDLLADDAARRAAHAMREEAQRMRAGWADVELNWGHKDGYAVGLQGSAAPIRDCKGRIVGFRGTCRLSSDALHPHAVVVAARQRIAEVLTTGAVDIALQPIVNLTSGQITGVEALARFQDGRGPDLWFADAHVADRTRALDEFTFIAALPLLASLPEAMYLSVNASPELLMDDGFRERLSTCGSNLSRLVIEITEHARVPDYGRLNDALAPLRAQGVRFAIDDTGAGYASLSHVLQLHPDIIKIDRGLIANLDADRARRSLVTALVLLALDVGASVTGEGVETHEQMDTLTTLGVDQVQGYLLARPTTDRTVWHGWWSRSWSSDSNPDTAPACMIRASTIGG